jgi:23S rRNA (uracil1939-C5)-methyltransferase
MYQIVTLRTSEDVNKAMSSTNRSGSRFRAPRQPRSTAVAYDKVAEFEIERIVPGGAGMGHGIGLTLFVPDTAPGDRIRARITRVQGKTGFGTIEEILEPSPVRIPDGEMRVHASGCDFAHMTYAAQLDAKKAIVADCLRRIGGMNPVPEVVIVPSPKEWEYRARAEWQFDGESRLVGSYGRGTHDVVEEDDLAILDPALQAVLHQLRERAHAGELPDERMEIRAAAGDEGATLHPPLLDEPERPLSVQIGDFSYWFDAECFFQANLSLAPSLIEEALRFAQPIPPAEDEEPRRHTAVDLYCGVGLFTLPLAKRFDRVHGVESYSLAVDFARHNAETAILGNIKLAALSVEKWLAERARGIGKVDFLVADPPRTGLDAKVVEQIVRLKPARIASVSCDPATQARDLKLLIAAGYRLESIVALDMFPQTHHVETVAHLVLE